MFKTHEKQHSATQPTNGFGKLNGDAHSPLPGNTNQPGKSEIKKVVLAYSGGLDTSVILRWLIETYGCEVIAYTADVGQGQELEGLEEKAIRTGASRFYIDDLKEDFVANYVFPAMRANAVYETHYLLGTSLARPVISKRLVEIAKLEGADAIVHGATGKGNDQVRFELSIQALAPELKVIAPWRTWDLKSRSELIAYAEAHEIPITVSKAKPYSIDQNLLHISFEGGVLEDPWKEAPAETHVMTVPPEQAPDTPEYVEISFESGNPVAVNGQEYTPAALLAELNQIAGAHGVGRIDIVENRYVGMKSRGVYETPGGTLLWLAHQAVESLTLDRDAAHLRDGLMPKYAEMIYYGYWFAPEREALQALIDKTQENVSGTARLKLYKGHVSVVGRKSEKSLYTSALSTFEEDDVYDQSHAEGFIKLNGLRLRLKSYQSTAEKA